MKLLTLLLGLCYTAHADNRPQLLWADGFVSVKDDFVSVTENNEIVYGGQFNAQFGLSSNWHLQLEAASIRFPEATALYYLFSFRPYWQHRKLNLGASYTYGNLGAFRSHWASVNFQHDQSDYLVLSGSLNLEVKNRDQRVQSAKLFFGMYPHPQLMIGKGFIVGDQPSLGFGFQFIIEWMPLKKLPFTLRGVLGGRLSEIAGVSLRYYFGKGSLRQQHRVGGFLEPHFR